MEIVTDFPTPVTRKVGDKVSIIGSDKYTGVWIIKSIAKVNATLEPEHGGRALRCPMWMLGDPDAATVAAAPTTYFVLGALARITTGKFAGPLYVVIADKGGDRVNLALLGGDGDRYVRMPRRSVVAVDPAEVLK